MTASDNSEPEQNLEACHCGFLEKKKSSILGTGWSKRFFMLYAATSTAPARLVYSKTEMQGEKSKEVVLPADGTRVSWSSTAGSASVIEIATPSGKMHLRTGMGIVRDGWVRAVKNAMADSASAASTPPTDISSPSNRPRFVSADTVASKPSNDGSYCGGNFGGSFHRRPSSIPYLSDLPRAGSNHGIDGINGVETNSPAPVSKVLSSWSAKEETQASSRAPPPRPPRKSELRVPDRVLDTSPSQGIRENGG